MPLVHAQREKNVAILRMDAPQQLNSFSEEMCKELVHNITEATNDEQVGAIILTGTGKAFSVGGDINMMQNCGFSPIEFHSWIVEHFGGVIGAITSSPKPIIAAVNGYAMGVGFFTALSCDMIVASTSARFGTAYIKIGLCPLGVSYILCRKLGYHRAFELCALGDEITGTQALEMGLINRLVDDTSLLPEAKAIAERLVAGPRTALAQTKIVLRNAFQNQSLQQHLEHTEAIQPLLLHSADHKEGREAVKEKRSPVFSKL